MQSQLSGGGDYPHCERLPLHTLHSPKALFEEGAFTSIPHCAGPAFAEAAAIVGIADGSGGGNEDGQVSIFFLSL